MSIYYILQEKYIFQMKYYISIFRILQHICYTTRISICWKFAKTDTVVLQYQYPLVSFHYPYSVKIKTLLSLHYLHI